MARRMSEVRLVASLLEQEADDVNQLAARVIDALDQDRRKRRNYVIRARVGDIYGIGPFATVSEAVKTAEKLSGEPDGRRFVERLAPLEIIDNLDSEPGLVVKYCPDCDHPTVAHNWPAFKRKRKGCVVSLDADGKQAKKHLCPCDSSGVPLPPV